MRTVTSGPGAPGPPAGPLAPPNSKACRKHEYSGSTDANPFADGFTLRWAERRKPAMADWRGSPEVSQLPFCRADASGLDRRNMITCNAGGSSGSYRVENGISDPSSRMA